ncbi:vacuolar cation/proton exchanger 3-like isoform X1 [Benincasa hispida]|uniref:vacuolar cation/proton exchanger 3-like isoform X1 n=1 Tax=Benincasa hispida TaxID=102211 RepID=UPI0019025812|nr:vacuolar cation/proton exchanger 3-like isoform X1 [Benincasa hispida]
MDFEPGTSILQNGAVKGSLRHARTAHNMSSSSLRKKSDLTLVPKVRFGCLRQLLVNLQEVIFGTRIWILFPAVPLAVLADSFGFPRPWVFVLSLLGLAPLAERLSFLTEQISYFTGHTVGGLLNATCGNATELIVAVFALSKDKIKLVKYSLLGSVLSNLLLVLGTSLFFGGIVNLKKEQTYDGRQAEVNSHMLLLALLCHSLPMLFPYAGGSADVAEGSVLRLSRAGSIIMLLAYVAYLIFHLWNHRRLFEEDKELDEYDDVVEEGPVIGKWSAMAWLVVVTLLIALLSEYVVTTIEDASETWGLSVAFLSIILLPMIGNAAEHAGAVIFAYKNKLDITLGVALGSATQIAMFVVPLCVIVAWVMGMNMDLNFNILETASLALSILASSSILQMRLLSTILGCRDPTKVTIVIFNIFQGWYFHKNILFGLGDYLK